MQIVPRKATLIGLGSAGVLALALAVPAVAFAEDPSTSPSPSVSSSASPDPGASSSDGSRDRTDQREQRRQKLAEGLAAELGVDVAKVTAALDKVEGNLADDAKANRQAKVKERLDAAVKEGKLTQEQADAIVKAAEAGVFAGPDGGFGGRGPRGGR